MKPRTKRVLISVMLIAISVVISISSTFIILSARDNKSFLGHDCPIPAKYQNMVHRLNKELKLPETIIFNWIDTESPGWIAEVGKNGERGLTQILPANIDNFEKLYYKGKKPFDPNDDECSLEVGMRHLADCLADSKDMFLALCMYNAGRTRILYGYIPESSQLYALKIMGLLKKR